MRPAPAGRTAISMSPGEPTRLSSTDGLERVMGIEPTLAAWEAAVLPLNYTRAGRGFYWATAREANNQMQAARPAPTARVARPSALPAVSVSQPHDRSADRATVAHRVHRGRHLLEARRCPMTAATLPARTPATISRWIWCRVNARQSSSLGSSDVRQQRIVYVREQHAAQLEVPERDAPRHDERLVGDDLVRGEAHHQVAAVVRRCTASTSPSPPRRRCRTRRRRRGCRSRRARPRRSRRRCS